MPDMLKHDHEWTRSFPPKTARDPRQRDMVSIFEPHLLRGSKTELDQTKRTHPVRQWFPSDGLLEGFYQTIFEHQTPVGKTLSIEPRDVIKTRESETKTKTN